MADFDGIKEREEGKKKMPLAMTVLFSGLVLFALAYIYLFTPNFTGWTQKARYEKTVKTGEALPPAQPKETKVAAAEAPAKGEKIYKESCAVCHGRKLEGGVGPALTGPKFIYGASLEDHIRVISKGTPKGMPAFGPQLGAAKIKSVARYIFSKRKH